MLAKLAAVDITTADQLRAELADGGAGLNARLRAAGHRAFNRETAANLLRLLNPLTETLAAFSCRLLSTEPRPDRLAALAELLAFVEPIAASSRRCEVLPGAAELLGAVCARLGECSRRREFCHFDDVPPVYPC